jgi:hypothetical protein
MLQQAADGGQPFAPCCRLEAARQPPHVGPTSMSIRNSATLPACTIPRVLSDSSLLPSRRPSLLPSVAAWRTITTRDTEGRPAPSALKGLPGLWC